MTYIELSLGIVIGIILSLVVDVATIRLYLNRYRILIFKKNLCH